MNKKPYDWKKDLSFVPPSVVRTSRVHVSEENRDLIREFFSDLMEKNSVRDTLCFVRKELPDGKVVRESQKVSASAFKIEVGVMFKYIHTIGVSQRILVSKEIDGSRIESVYTISG